ncbi:hypothetical protein BJV78DRAFT_810767 [Lactifluus subvellereus]|nr:hypothetical protein BJV78DRAFT_810767 [Lactifluus subvellereus]
MTMGSTNPPDTSPEMSAAPVSSSTPPHRGSETRDDGSLAQLHVHDNSASLDVDTTTTLPPLAGTSSLKVPLPDDNRSPGSKRKLGDSDFSEASSDNASDAEERSRAGKKLKQECQDDEDSSLIPSGHISDDAAIVNLDSEQSASPSLDDPLVPRRPDSSDPFLPDVLPSPSTAPLDLPHALTSPPRPHSAPPTSPTITNGTLRVHPFPPPSSLPQDPEPLHTYSCPICFASPTNATLTPCGHIMCGECLFTAVGAAAARMGIASLAARCPVCRATIPKWDGRGGGVIGLQPRVVITI